MISHKKRAQVQPQRLALRALFGSCPYAQVHPYNEVGAKHGFQTNVTPKKIYYKIIVASFTVGIKVCPNL